MSVIGDFFRYSQNALQPVDIALAEPIAVADSWLVTNHNSRALGRHLKRFSNSITDEVTEGQLEGFFEAVISQVPEHGDWFPRLEYRSDQPLGERLFLRMRPAPERTETCTLWTYDQSDPRLNPAIKGPDLSTCQKLRRVANLHGADEAVLLDEKGVVSDGALSSIVWWHDDILCGPDDSTAWLPSITRELVFELASQAGYETQLVAETPEDLEGSEVWSLSALQGIRGVTSWNGVDVGPLRLLKPFRKRLAMLFEPIQAGLSQYRQNHNASAPNPGGDLLSD
jgi:branched-subunit amino acid aminotransferase/4-amino-4-deoxychorismate lyase